MKTSDQFGVFVNGAAWKVHTGVDAQAQAQAQADGIIKSGLSPRYVQGFNEARKSAVVHVPNRVKIEKNPDTYTSGEIVFSWEERV